MQTHVVQSNRDAEHLQFPLPEPDHAPTAELHSSAALADRFEVRPGLEATVSLADL